MTTRFERVAYESLNARQQEAYNFQKVSAVLADYGFVTLRLTSDWQGADFIAQRFDGTFLKVQLKGRLTFDKKYQGLGLHVCFPHNGHWFMYVHDELLTQVLDVTAVASSESWVLNGGYSFPRLSQKLSALLAPHRLS